MLAAPAVGYFLGRYLDSLLGTAGIFMMVFLFLGVAAGGMEAYRIIKQIIKESDD
jgi:F0F1-type ATP synthase assembly protein I